MRAPELYGVNAATPRRLGRATVLAAAGVVLGVAATRRARRTVSLDRKLAGIHDGLVKLDVLRRRLDAALAEVDAAAHGSNKARAKAGSPKMEWTVNDGRASRPGDRELLRGPSSAVPLDSRHSLPELLDLPSEAAELLERGCEAGGESRVAVDYVALELARARVLFRELGGTWPFLSDALEGVDDHVGPVGAEEVGMHGFSSSSVEPVLPLPPAVSPAADTAEAPEGTAGVRHVPTCVSAPPYSPGGAR